MAEKQESDDKPRTTPKLRVQDMTILIFTEDKAGKKPDASKGQR